MPKMEPKQIQKELETGKIRSVYWFFGSERMKSRELVKRIRAKVFGEEAGDDAGGFAQGGGFSIFATSFRETVLDAADCEVSEVLDSAQSLSLGGGGKLVIVKQAHLLKHPEPLIELCASEFADIGSGASVTVFLSKDLDQRKKFSKALLEKAACVPCEEIPEQDREAWVGYLAKRKGLTLSEPETASLRAMDTWSLDHVERELEKIEAVARTEDREAVLLGGAEGKNASENFVDAFFHRDGPVALAEVPHFATSPESALPLLGLLGWNVKMLISLLKDQDAGTRESKLGSFMAERFGRYAKFWTLAEAIHLSKSLAEVDFSTKQTSRDPLGFWTALVLQHARVSK
ncbi:MAG: hypothetical protein H7301_14415 [Cryobacterium sp.]|nr:hypothetical protein [Oligoflexia bacterium]